ncbi:hypothetical protein MKZ38_002456 [Zalerion maritima]|uniref:Rhodopsin domain-containing protein n=1 Tax=Zalerion maritima TaxID=339359 RepID=A0AAD5WSG5_9PEZI|nr:hypothetical protein MKZ38_002456 [Zalerion maritima]
MSFPVTNGVTTFLAPPDGYVVDFENPQRRANVETYWICGVENVIALLFLGQRFYTRIFITGGLQYDDFMFAYPAGGVHAWEISLDTFNVFMKQASLYPFAPEQLVYVASIIYVWCGAFAKLALLVFYYRLSPQLWFRWAIMATIVFVVGSSAGIFFSLIFACDPIAMSWDVAIPGECINRTALYIATAVANIVSDLIILVLPVKVIIGLRITRQQKMGLLALFVIGSLTLVTSAVRASILPEMLTSADQTWVISYASLWIVVETNLFVICASIPTLRKFFRHVAPRFIGESTYDKNGRGSKSRANTKSSGRGAGPRGAAGSGGGGLGGSTLKPASNQLITFGSSRDPKLGRYAKFDDDDDDDDDYTEDEYALTAISGPVKKKKKKKKSGRLVRRGGGEEGDRSGGEGGATIGSWGGEGTVMGSSSDDGDSAKAIVPPAGIVQTTTVTVEFNKSTEAGKKRERGEE